MSYFRRGQQVGHMRTAMCYNNHLTPTQKKTKSNQKELFLRPYCGQTWPLNVLYLKNNVHNVISTFFHV